MCACSRTVQITVVAHGQETCMGHIGAASQHSGVCVVSVSSSYSEMDWRRHSSPAHTGSEMRQPPPRVLLLNRLSLRKPRSGPQF